VQRLLEKSTYSALRQGLAGQVKPTPFSALRGSTASNAEEEREGPVGGAEIAQRASYPTVQRACGRAGIGTAVGGCIDLSGDAVGELILFRVNCDDFLSAGEQTKVEDFADTMIDSDRVKIHGFASVDGPANYNTDLSCARAKKAADLLAGKGISRARIELFRHGPTPGAPGNRRSVVLERDPPVSRAPTITSETVKAAPSGADNRRERVGVGEEVDFTGSAVGSWTASIGTPLGLSGRAFRWTAPAVTSETSATITLAVGAQLVTKTMTVVPPSMISMRKVSSHSSLVGAGGACMLNEVTFGPGDVCLGAIMWLEVDGPATSVSGFFTKFSAATLYHHPNPNYALVDDNNVMEAGPNNGPHDHCAWHSTPGPYSVGAFEWVVPNRYILDGENAASGRHFTDTTQRFTMDAAGVMTITKAGAST
jgi:outer membrane protein OmpA-like peptidoglycan-associated protein